MLVTDIGDKVVYPLARGIRLIREETIANVLHAKYVLAVPEINTGCYVSIKDTFSERWQHSASL
jgi:hypothetical protein